MGGSGELPPFLRTDELARRHHDDWPAASIQLDLLHLTSRLLIMQMVIVMDHATAAVSQLYHEHSLFHPAVGTR